MGCCGRSRGCTCVIEAEAPLTVVDEGFGLFRLGVDEAQLCAAVAACTPGGIGGSLTGSETPAPSTSAVLPLVAGSPLTGMTVADGRVTSLVTALWEFGGTLVFTTDYPTPYVMDVDVWLAWQESGQSVTSILSEGSGQIGGGNVLRIPVEIGARLLAGVPVDLRVQTFGREANDPNVRVAADLIAVQLLEDKSPPVQAPADTPPTGVLRLGGGRVASADQPYDGTDLVMRWSGVYISGDAYKRGVTVTHDSKTWVARVDRPDGEPGPASSGWAEVLAAGGGTGDEWTWEGAWRPDAVYPKGSAVESDGSSYVTWEDVPAGVTPPAVPWELIAARGAIGPRGLQGERGEKGDKGDPAATGYLYATNVGEKVTLADGGAPAINLRQMPGKPLPSGARIEADGTITLLTPGIWRIVQHSTIYTNSDNRFPRARLWTTVSSAASPDNYLEGTFTVDDTYRGMETTYAHSVSSDFVITDELAGVRLDARLHGESAQAQFRLYLAYAGAVSTAMAAPESPA